MKCPNCGSEIKDNLKYCIICGEPIYQAQPENKTSQSLKQSPYYDLHEERGKLILSTKETALTKVAVVVACAICFVIGLVILVNLSMETDFYQFKLFGPSAGWIFELVVALFLMGCAPVSIYQTNKSFCNIYDDGVTGRTVGIIGLFGIQDFQIRYNEIVNVTKSSGRLTIYTNYTKYNVLAIDNNEKNKIIKEMAVKTIRNKMTGNGNLYHNM